MPNTAIGSFLRRALGLGLRSAFRVGSAARVVRGDARDGAVGIQSGSFGGR